MKNLARRVALSTLTVVAVMTGSGCNSVDLLGVDYDHYYGETGGAEGFGDDEGAESAYTSADADAGDAGEDGGESGDDEGAYLGPVCGDGNLDAGEACDDGSENADAAACTAACEINVCGDGLVFAGVEECDEGAANGPDEMCTDACVAQGPA